MAQTTAGFKSAGLCGPMIRYDVSPWLERVARRSQPIFARQRGPLTVDVVVIGGGLAGCLAAYELRRAGARVALVEGGRIGQGATAASLGTIAPGPGAPFLTLRERHGLRIARSMWEATRRSALDFMALVRRLRLQCDLVSCDQLQIATSDDQADAFEREYAALTDAGFEAAWLAPPRLREGLGIEALGALKLPGAGLVDPYRACLAVARLASRDGALVFEQTEARRITTARRGVEVLTAAGALTAAAVVVATGAPAPRLGPLERHFRVEEPYAVALPAVTPARRRAFGKTTAIAGDGATPPHAWRWTRDGRLIFCGASGAPVAAREREPTVVRRTGQLMYELSLFYPHVSGTLPETGWAVRAVSTADGVMVAGTHRGFPRHLFALGLGRCGASAAWLAGRVLARGWAGAASKGDELFGFIR